MRLQVQVTHICDFRETAEITANESGRNVLEKSSDSGMGSGRCLQH